MKLYTNEIQTAKLIELGFEKPKGWYVDGVTNNIKLYVNIDENLMMFNYSIGELIEMLETRAVSINIHNLKWSVDTYHYGIDKYELIDALYAMVVKLKEEGEI